MSWSLKAEKNLVSQGKAEKKTFYVREQSEQRWAWKKAKECLVTGNGGARRHEGFKGPPVKKESLKSCLEELKTWDL